MWPINPIVRHIIRENHTLQRYPHPMFTAALFTIAKTRKQPKCPLTNAAAAAKSLQSCLTLCDPIDGSPPGSPIPRILQARTLEWVAISFSNAWKWKVKVKSLSPVGFFVTPWTVAYQAPHPWDFPGKSTGVGCHFLLQLIHAPLCK